MSSLEHAIYIVNFKSGFDCNYNLAGIGKEGLF